MTDNYILKVLALNMFGLVLFLPFILYAQPLTLPECLERGFTHNPEVKAYELAVEEAERGISEAWGAFLPTLSLSYNHSELSNGNSNERDTDFLDQASDSFICRLTQPLFTGLSGVAGLKRARQSKEYRLVELTFMKKQLVMRISSSFYNFHYALQRAEQWQMSVKRLEQQKEIAIAWVEQRLAPRLRLYEIELELSNARHELIRANADRAVAAAKLRQWLAYDPNHNVQVSSSPQLESVPPCSDLDYCRQLALEQRPEIELSRLNIEMAHQDAKMIVARNLPQANLDASWTDYQRDFVSSSYSTDDRNYYSVSLNLSMKLFQGGRNVFAWQKQRIAIKRLQQQQINQYDLIISEVQIRYEQLKESQAAVKNAKDALAKAEEAYNLSAKSTELGVSSLNDLLEAELRLTRANVMLIDSRAAMLQAKVGLDFAVGNSWFK